MSLRGRDGHWNQAGRRSGGSRPTEIVVPRLLAEFEYGCAVCGEPDSPWTVTRGCHGCEKKRREYIKARDASRESAAREKRDG